MNQSQRKRAAAKWQKIESRLAAGDIPAVFTSADGKLCLQETSETIPSRLEPLWPSEVVELSRSRRAMLEQQAQEQRRLRVEDAMERQRSLDASVDLSACCLIAGENSRTVATGDLEHCRSMLPLVCGEPTDPHGRTGAWVIFASSKATGEFVEYESGTFDKGGFA